MRLTEPAELGRHGVITASIDNWIDQATTEGIGPAEFASRGINVAHARQGGLLD